MEMTWQTVGFKRDGHVVAQILCQRSFLVQRRCVRDDMNAAGVGVAPSRRGKTWDDSFDDDDDNNSDYDGTIMWWWL
ncbi:hypothetical protein VNO77_25896 [Canavalia gladiata]|uniref:Uncharacterized protein n=1 Tax=Canavalia gladiata TaxID=3824 RepID=A0AAN9KUC7_CANGL